VNQTAAEVSSNVLSSPWKNACMYENL
jgi:hypothetical protein